MKKILGLVALLMVQTSQACEHLDTLRSIRTNLKTTVFRFQNNTITEAEYDDVRQLICDADTVLAASCSQCYQIFSKRLRYFASMIVDYLKRE